MKHYWSKPMLKTCVLIKLEVFTSACSLWWVCVELKLDLLHSHKELHGVQFIIIIIIFFLLPLSIFFSGGCALYKWECFRLLPPSGHPEYSSLSNSPGTGHQTSSSDRSLSRSILMGVVPSRMTPPPSTGQEVSLSSQMKMKMM